MDTIIKREKILKIVERMMVGTLEGGAYLEKEY